MKNRNLFPKCYPCLCGKLMTRNNNLDYYCSNKKCYRYTNPIHGSPIGCERLGDTVEETDANAGYKRVIKGNILTTFIRYPNGATEKVKLVITNK